MVVSGVCVAVTILPTRALSFNCSPMRIRGNTKCALTAARPDPTISSAPSVSSTNIPAIRSAFSASSVARPSDFHSL